MGFEGGTRISEEDHERSQRVAKLMINNKLPYPAAVRRMMVGRGITDETDISNAIKRLSAATDSAFKTLLTEQAAKQADEEEIRRDLKTLSPKEFDTKYPLV